MKQNVTKVASSCFYNLRRLKQIRRVVGKEVTAQLVSEFLSFLALTTVMLCLRGCHAPPQTHYSRTWQLVWCSTFVFVTLSIVDNFCKKPTVRIVCSALVEFLFHTCVLILSASGRGCHVANIYVGVLMYADDLLLIYMQ